MNSQRKVVYLCGPVASISDGGASWREKIKDNYGDYFEFRDPLSKYNVHVDGLEIVRGRSDPDDVWTVGIDEIVEGDKQLLRESDAVLVGYSRVHSIGSPMEAMWAFDRDYPVALWVRDDTPVEDLSPWYRYHASVSYSAWDALTSLSSQPTKTDRGGYKLGDRDGPSGGWLVDLPETGTERGEADD